MSNVRKYGKYTPYHDVNDTVVSLLPVDVVLGVVVVEATTRSVGGINFLRIAFGMYQ